MKKLELNQMENLEAGKNLPCSDALALGALGMALVGTGPMGWMVVAAFMLACD